MPIFFNLYLFFITLFVFVPCSLVGQVFSFLQRPLRARPKSYFGDTSPSPKYFVFQGVRCYHLATFLALFFLTPCRYGRRFFDRKLFLPSTRRYSATPNQAAALVINQIVGNLRGVEAVAKKCHADYLFALQPSLMVTGPATQDDKLFYESRNRTHIWGFSWSRFFKTYYDRLIETLQKDEVLKDHFLDLSRLFENTKEQMFVDTMHMGDLGQEKCARVLSEMIWRRSSSKRC